MIQFFNSIFIFLTTENELLVNLMYIPMVFVEAFAQMSFFTTFLKEKIRICSFLTKRVILFSAFENKKEAAAL